MPGLEDRRKYFGAACPENPRKAPFLPFCCHFFSPAQIYGTKRPHLSLLFRGQQQHNKIFFALGKNLLKIFAGFSPTA